MHLVQLRIELPAYSHSFYIHVYNSSTIFQVKQEISRICPGEPRAEGQRLIWRGRSLADAERVEDVWESATDPRVVHLAVHPSAWTKHPPEIPQLAPGRTSAQATPCSPPSRVVANPNAFSSLRSESPHHHVPDPTTSSMFKPLPYFVNKHQNALLALTTGVSPPADLSGNTEFRDVAITAVERAGWIWPSILDEDYPRVSEGGIKYERTIIDGQPYLSLQDPTVQPTPVQAHSLRILSYTFTLLTISVNTTTFTRNLASHQLNNLPPNVNQLLQQLGLPPLRIAPNHNLDQNGIIPQLREMPVRPLIFPLMMLLFRTLLLLYFVAPARKPIFGVIILAWMLYEIWQPIRNGLRRGWQRVAEDPVVPDGGLRPAAEQNVADNGQPPRPQPRPVVNIPGQGAGALGAGRIDVQAGVVLNNLANLNIEAEENIINQTPGSSFDKPSFGHKLVSFLGLLFTTLHPAVWNRRRVALRRREGVIRTEANVRGAPSTEVEDEPGSAEGGESSAHIRAELRAQHARRPQWIQKYMERVVAEEWVDDSD